MKSPIYLLAGAACAGVAAIASSLALASSHREAPFITTSPKVDATDVYAFRSYETGRQDYVTIIANYIPFQDPQGGAEFLHVRPDRALRDPCRQ